MNNYDKYIQMGEPKLGVYLAPNGKFKLVSKEDHKYIVDEGIMKQHPIFRANYHVVNTMTGHYFINKKIHNCEYLGELGEDIQASNDSESKNNQNLLY